MTENETLIEERNSLIISPVEGKFTYRTSHFLKPSILISNQAQVFLNPPPNYIPTQPISSIITSLTSKVRFNGWTKPPTEWSSWVENLRPSFESTWKKASIFEAIMCSKLKIPKCKSHIFGLAEKWCPETSTFILPWGEVTMTLEDVVILGGFSATGAFVRSQIQKKEYLEIEEILLEARSDLIKTKARKPSQKQWMDKWMGTGRAFEHEAFLSLWLSRYVLPADDFGTINKKVFKIAIFLSRGIKIALAPAVLASMYRDLRLLKEKIAAIRGLGDRDYESVANFVTCSPLYLLKIWFWERFPKFNPKPNQLTSGLCWAERWDKVEALEYCEVNLATNASGDFQWRPYSSFPDESCPNYLNLDMQSYEMCIRVGQLVGMDCIEKYFPHRVARQFGLDQNIPNHIIFQSHDPKQDSWKNYNRPVGDIMLYKAPKLFKAGVTPTYFKWWSGENKVGISKVSIAKEERLRITDKNDELDVPPGFSPIFQRVAAKGDYSSFQHQPSSKRSKLRQYSSCLSIDREGHFNASLGSSNQIKGLLGDGDDCGSEIAHILEKTIRMNGFRREIKSGAMSIIHEDDLYPGEKRTRIDETKVGSSIKNPIIIGKEVQANINGANDSDEDMDLLDRIFRLERIVDLVKTTKIDVASAGEIAGGIKLSRKKLEQKKCGNCKQADHNIRTCPLLKAVGINIRSQNNITTATTQSVAAGTSSKNDEFAQPCSTKDTPLNNAEA